jgi:endonuclease-3
MAKGKKGIDKDDARQRVLKFFPILRKTYPEAKVSLDFINPLELMVATILAAQCTDLRVNIVTKDLFKKYRKVQDWIKVPQAELEQDIRSTGFYHNKAANIQKACKTLIENFHGQVPQTMEELLTLGGVGRKTANVILGNCFGVQGIICDTHMIRLSRRLGLSENEDPTKLEFDSAIASSFTAGPAATPASPIAPTARSPNTAPQPTIRSCGNASIKSDEIFKHPQRNKRRQSPGCLRNTSGSITRSCCQCHCPQGLCGCGHEYLYQGFR